MFVTDFQISQGVLFVETTPITTNHAIESHPFNEAFLQTFLSDTFGATTQQANIVVQVCPGDFPVVKP